MTTSKYITNSNLSTWTNTKMSIRRFNYKVSYSTCVRKCSNQWSKKKIIKNFMSTTTNTTALSENKTLLQRLYVADGEFCNAVLDYTASPARFTSISNYSLQALEFEKKVCRAGFRNNFGQNLPSPGTLVMHFGLLDVNPTHNSSRWSAKANRSAPIQMRWSPGVLHHTDHVRKSSGGRYSTVLTSGFCFKSHAAALSDCNYDRKPTAVVSIHHEKMDKRLIHSGIQLMSSDWILEGLTQQIQNRRSVRAVMHELIRDAEVLLNSLQSACPVLGVRISASGRLGKQKKGMAQRQSLSIGKVPLGTFNRKVDYSQGFALTKRGLVGLKVWVAFR